MTKSIWVVVATVLALTGCSKGRLVIESDWLTRLFASKPKPTYPLVYVDATDGGSPIVIVDQEPLRIRVKKNGSAFQPVLIQFSLETSGYVFAPALSTNPLNLSAVATKGTSSSSVPPVSCGFGGPQGTDATQMNCSYTPTVLPAYYSYTIRVQDTANPNNYYTSDPTVMND